MSPTCWKFFRSFSLVLRQIAPLSDSCLYPQPLHQIPPPPPILAAVAQTHRNNFLPWSSLMCCTFCLEHPSVLSLPRASLVNLPIWSQSTPWSWINLLSLSFKLHCAYTYSCPLLTFVWIFHEKAKLDESKKFVSLYLPLFCFPQCLEPNRCLINMFWVNEGNN